MLPPAFTPNDCELCGAPTTHWERGIHLSCIQTIISHEYFPGAETCLCQESRAEELATPRSQLYVYPTWLSKLIAGEVHCEWSVWFRVHYQNWERPPSDFDSATFNMNHTRLAREMRLERDTTKERLYVESQAEFWYTHPSGIRISGRPDLVTVGADGNCIYDAKTTQPKASDKIQLLLYMYCLPRSEHYQLAGKDFSGQIKYWDHVVNVEPTAIRGNFEDQFDYWMDILASDTPPDRLPSERECGFCNIGKADCDERLAAVVLEE